MNRSLLEDGVRFGCAVSDLLSLSIREGYPHADDDEREVIKDRWVELLTQGGHSGSADATRRALRIIGLALDGADPELVDLSGGE